MELLTERRPRGRGRGAEIRPQRHLLPRPAGHRPVPRRAFRAARYDPHKVALMITQTGGGCRASNYIHLLRKALAKAGYGYVPVISLNLDGAGEEQRLPASPSAVLRMAIAALAYGDLLMLARQPDQALREAARATARRPSRAGRKGCRTCWRRARAASCATSSASPSRSPRSSTPSPVYPKNKLKVGIVGEIYVKYSALGNNGLEKFLLEPGLRGLTCRACWDLRCIWSTTA